MTCCIQTSPDRPPYSFGQSGAAYGLVPMVPCQAKGLKPESALIFSRVASSPDSTASTHPFGNASASQSRNSARKACCCSVSSISQRTPPSPGGAEAPPYIDWRVNKLGQHMGGSP